MSHFADHKGTYRLERLSKALANDYFKLDDRSTEDLLAQTAELASHIKFYNEQNLVDGNWEAFFEEVYDYVLHQVSMQKFKEDETEAQVPSHLALYFAFIEVFHIAQEELNRFTQRHLEYYYNNILKFERKNAVADQVHLFFGIDSKEVKAMVPKGTLFEGGNDNNGKKRLYASDFDVIVNKSEIDQVKSVTIDGDNSMVQDNTLNDTASRPFEFGFAVSSPVLFLKDGVREIQIYFSTNAVAQLVRNCQRIEYSSPEGWQTVAPSNIRISNNELVVSVSKALPPLVAYAEPIHQMRLNAKDPVLRFSFGKDSLGLLDKSSQLIGSITANVKESTDLLLYNDYGKLNNGIPFLPFGPNPVVGSSRFLIGNNKIFNKYLHSFRFSIEWRGLPGDVDKYYASYKDGMELAGYDYVAFSKAIKSFAKDKENVFPGCYSFLKDGEWKEKPKNFETNGNNRISGTRGFFPDQGDAVRQTQSEYSNDVKSGFIKVVLTTDFGHDVYSKLLGRVMVENTKTVIKDGVAVSNSQSKTIPEKPYIPEIQSVLLDYTLTAYSDADDFQMFVIHPFLNEEVDRKNNALFRVHSPAVKLQKGQSQKCYYFGVANVNAGSELSVFFDIDNPIINDGNGYSWSYFRQGEWRLFEEKEIVRDNTEKLVKSGIITFMLPEDAELADDRLWLCLSMVSDKGKFPIVLNVRTNCVTATFVDDGNELSHLKAGLPAQTIQKFVERNPKIKTVEQPFLSFGGKEAENDTDYYIRVSERLRHRGRASTAWDYERLALEAFPQISFALCMPHTHLTDTDNEMAFAPGCVTLLVSPDVDIVRQEDKFKPVVPAMVVNEIRSYLEGVSSGHVSIDVSNFKYKEVQVSCDVRLRKGFSDISYYRDKLDSDLRTFISPWIGEGADKFDRNMTYNSKNVAEVYAFLEQLEYVDFVVSAEIMVDGRTYTIADKTIDKKQNEIFTSAENHNITIK